MSNMRNQFEELHHRLAAVRHKLAEWGVDGVLISGDSNRRWLSGFTGSFGYLLATQEKALLATDFRYWEQATVQAPAFTLFKYQRRQEDMEALLAAAGVARLGLEGQQMSVLEAGKWRGINVDMRYVTLAETVEPLRQVKSAAELETMRAAAAITDQAMAQVPRLARPGLSERRLAWELEKWMREAGAEATAFTVIVASGPNSALPHHRPGDRLLQAGDAVIVDMGAQVDGYKSDLTRTFYLGDEPDERFRRIFDLVLRAQTAVLDGLRPGMTGNAADALARDVIVEAGHGEQFGHGLGHGVGLDIHEGPSLTFREEGKETLAPGIVTTVEPGVYLPGWGGVRIEDLVHLTETGAESLSQAPKAPAVSTTAGS